MDRPWNGWTTKTLAVLLWLSAVTLAHAGRAAGDVTVNGTPLSANQIKFLEGQ